MIPIADNLPLQAAARHPGARWWAPPGDDEKVARVVEILAMRIIHELVVASRGQRVVGPLDRGSA